LGGRASATARFLFPDAGDVGAFKRALGDLPVLVGPSRKRFLGALTGDAAPADRDAATAAACVAAVPHADVARVHDAAGVKRALAVADALWR